MLIAFVGRVRRSRLIFPKGGAAAFLLDEGICDEVVDEGRVDGGVGAGPKNDTGGGNNFECVEHGAEIAARCVSGQGQDGRELW